MPVKALFRTLLPLILSLQTYSALLQGPNQNDSSLMPFVTDMSDDGSIFIGATHNLELLYYKVDENGSMTLIENSSLSSFMDDIDVSSDGRMVGMAGNNSVMIYNITSNSLISFQNISVSFSYAIKSVSFSSDLNYLIMGEDSGNVLLYKLSGTYGSFENLTYSQRTIGRMSPVNNYFVTGGDEKVLKVYKIGSTSSSLLQSLSTPDVILRIKISPDETYMYVLLPNSLRIY